MHTCSTVNYIAPFLSAIYIEKSPFDENIFKINICYSCTEPACADSCPTGYLEKRDGGGVKINKKSQCISCGNCIEACTYSYLKSDFKGVPVICKNCGICVRNCPNKCLIMVDDNE